MLLNPIWLFALAAVCIPVVIHLWNIKPGKTLKVGSISLLSESSPKSSRSFKLLDIPLLLLRCLLLILLALLLTGPIWQQHIKAGKAKGWVLVPKENFNEVYHHFKPAIDSISKKGYEFHYFNSGFAKADLNELLQHPGTDTASRQPDNYWTLVKQLHQQMPASLTAELFTPNTAVHFTGEKPAAASAINWHTYIPADSVSTWLNKAWLTNTGSIKIVQGTATPSGTTYQYSEMKNGGQSGSQYTVGIENGVPAVSMKDSKINVDTTTLRIAVYADKNGSDAAYLIAALEAINQFNQQKTIIKLYPSPEAIPADQTWVFWLSEKPLSSSIMQHSKNIFQYEAGKPAEINSWISNNGTYTVTQGQEKVAVFKLINASSTTASAIWTNGFGAPVLSTETKDKATIYHFYSRFNPAWNELVWNDEFPRWLLKIINGPSAETGNMHDRRMLSQQQIQPVQATEAGMAPDVQIKYIDLTHYLWLALALSFLAERWLAHKNRIVLTNG